MTAVSMRLIAQGFAVERDAETTPDCYWVVGASSIHPAWVILRTDDGRYQLRDDLLGVAFEGSSLLEVLPSDWIRGAANERGRPVGDYDTAIPMAALVAR